MFKEILKTIVNQKEKTKTENEMISLWSDWKKAGILADEAAPPPGESELKAICERTIQLYKTEMARWEEKGGLKGIFKKKETKTHEKALEGFILMENMTRHLKACLMPGELKSCLVSAQPEGSACSPRDRLYPQPPAYSAGMGVLAPIVKISGGQLHVEDDPKILEIETQVGILEQARERDQATRTGLIKKVEEIKETTAAVARQQEAGMRESWDKVGRMDLKVQEIGRQIDAINLASAPEGPTGERLTVRPDSSFNLADPTNLTCHFPTRVDPGQYPVAFSTPVKDPKYQYYEGMIPPIVPTPEERRVSPGRIALNRRVTIPGLPGCNRTAQQHPHAGPCLNNQQGSRIIDQEGPGVKDTLTGKVYYESPLQVEQGACGYTSPESVQLALQSRSIIRQTGGFAATMARTNLERMEKQVLQGINDNTMRKLRKECSEILDQDEDRQGKVDRKILEEYQEAVTARAAQMRKEEVGKSREWLEERRRQTDKSTEEFMALAGGQKDRSLDSADEELVSELEWRGIAVNDEEIQRVVDQLNRSMSPAGKKEREEKARQAWRLGTRSEEKYSTIRPPTGPGLKKATRKLDFLAPLVRNPYTRQEDYVPWKHCDLQTMTKSLPPLGEGAGPWIQQFEKASLGIKLANGDISVLLERCGMSEVAKKAVLREAEMTYRNSEYEHVLDEEESFDHHRNHLWDVLRAKYPVKLRMEQMTSRPYQTSQEPHMWIREHNDRFLAATGERFDQNETMKRFCRESLIKNMPSKAAAHMLKTVGITNKSQTDFEDHVVHWLQWYREQEKTKEETRKELKTKMMKVAVGLEKKAKPGKKNKQKQRRQEVAESEDSEEEICHIEPKSDKQNQSIEAQMTRSMAPVVAALNQTITALNSAPQTPRQNQGNYPPQQQQTYQGNFARAPYQGNAPFPKDQYGNILWDQVQCYRCKGYGHTANRCDQQQQGQRQNQAPPRGGGGNRGRGRGQARPNQGQAPVQGGPRTFQSQDVRQTQQVYVPNPGNQHPVVGAYDSQDYQDYQDYQE